ncbi:MAG TPA: hypothetical protein VFW35_07935 [Sphingomicrobium sp.]|nr:hypothetical protein [Sphingomicrobium sp.]
MPTFRITVINQTFSACDEHELPSFEAARMQGIKAALEIGSDEVANGNPFFAAEVLVADGDETLGRFVVSIGASSIQ